GLGTRLRIHREGRPGSEPGRLRGRDALPSTGAAVDLLVVNLRTRSPLFGRRGRTTRWRLGRAPGGSGEECRVRRKAGGSWNRPRSRPPVAEPAHRPCSAADRRGRTPTYFAPRQSRSP